MNAGSETWKSKVEAELLAVASVADHLRGPFQSGYLQAIEEIAERLGLSEEVKNVSTYDTESLELPLDTLHRHMAALGDALGAGAVEKAKLAQMELATFVRPFVASQPNPYIADSACALVARCHGWLKRFCLAPDAAAWGSRAMELINGLAQALCFLRDRGYLRLSAGKFMDLLNLGAIENLVWSHSITIHGKELRIDDAAFANALEPLTQFVLSLPGYGRERVGKQDLITQEKFDYVAMVASGPIRGIAAAPTNDSIASGAPVNGINAELIDMLIEVLDKVPLIDSTRMVTPTATKARAVIAKARAAMQAAPVNGGEHYAELEREHFGDPDKRTGIYAEHAADAPQMGVDMLTYDQAEQALCAAYGRGWRATPTAFTDATKVGGDVPAVWGASTLGELDAALDGAHELSGPPHERINTLIRQRDKARAALSADGGDRKDAEIANLKAVAKEYDDLIHHMNAGGDFFEFCAAIAEKAKGGA